MASYTKEIACAEDHHDSAGLLMDRQPLIACEHLLSAVVHAAKAANAGWAGPIDFKAIPGRAYQKSDPAAMTKLTADLRKHTREGGVCPQELARFGKEASRTVSTFIQDMKDNLYTEPPADFSQTPSTPEFRM